MKKAAKEAKKEVAKEKKLAPVKTLEVIQPVPKPVTNPIMATMDATMKKEPAKKATPAKKVEPSKQELRKQEPPKQDLLAVDNKFSLAPTKKAPPPIVAREKTLEEVLGFSLDDPDPPISFVRSPSAGMTFNE